MAKITCPRGIEFVSKASMFKYYGVSRTGYIKRLDNGWTERQALGIDPPPECIKCPNGLIFSTVGSMCTHYGIIRGNYITRIKNGWTERQALGIDPPPNLRTVTCPNGLNFKSERQMCEYYNVNVHSYYSSINTMGCTREQALGIEPKPNSVVCPKGMIFNSGKQMCDYYGVLQVTYLDRRGRGWTELQALGVDPPPVGRGTKFVNSEVHSWNGSLSILQKENTIKGTQFYLVQDKKTLRNYVLTEEQIKAYPKCLQTFIKKK